MITNTQPLAQLRLMQLISPSLPIGAFTYSQGLEYAVETGWVNDVESFEDWLLGLLLDNITYLDIPVLVRLYKAFEQKDAAALKHWSAFVLASRETSELRQEEINRAKAFTKLLSDLDIDCPDIWQESLQRCQLVPFALAAQNWDIDQHNMALGYVWGWLENQVVAAIKLVPLGQTQGQQVQARIMQHIPQAVSQALAVQDEDIGASSPAVALVSSWHETQYSRLFRS